MENHAYKLLIKEYEKLNAARPDMYPFSFGGCTERLADSFSKPHHQTASKEKQIKVALLWMRDGGALMKYYYVLARTLASTNHLPFSNQRLVC